MVGKLLGGGLVLLGTALWCRGEIQARRRETDRAAELAAAGPDWRTNGNTQIDWGLNYIQDRYGTPCQALTFRKAHNWY